MEKPTLEEVERVLGVKLPEAPEGYTWEYSFIEPIKGDTILDNRKIWRKVVNSGNLSFPTLRPVRTHREDGTPMDIDPLPEFSDFRAVYAGTEVSCLGDADAYARFNELSDNPEWHAMAEGRQPSGDPRAHYALLYKIQQPTTLEDLIGEDYQKRAFLIGDVTGWEEFHPVQEDDSWGDNVHGSVKNMAELGFRWSHIPHTSWKDANEFVVEGGGE